MEPSVIELFSAIARSNQRPLTTLDAVLDEGQLPGTVRKLRPQIDDQIIRGPLPGRGTYPGR